MSIAMIILLYIIILTIVMRKTNQNLAHHHNNHKPKHKWSNCLFYILFIFSLLAFEILLTNKLDQEMSSTNLIQQLHSIISMQSAPNLPSQYQIPIVAQQQQYQQHQQQLHQQQQQLQQQPYQQQQPVNNIIPAQFYYNQMNQQQQQQLYQHQQQMSSNRNSSLSPIRLSYFHVSLPLYVTYLSLIFLSFNNHTGNTLWFGMRRDFCEYFLLMCPVFKTYGNVQIKWSFPKSSSRYILLGLFSVYM